MDADKSAEKPPLIPKVLFFDAAGTLFHLPSGVGHHYWEVLQRYGVQREEAALESAFSAAWAEVAAPQMAEGRRADDDRGWWRTLVDQVLDRCEVEAAELPERATFFEELYAEFVRPAVWRLYPEVHEVLSELAADFTLGVISNFDPRYYKIAEQLEIARYFTYTILSSEVGADKPAREIYERALEIAGVTAGEAMHIGDDPVADWHGAARAGLRVFELDRPRYSLRDVIPLVRA